MTDTDIVIVLRQRHGNVTGNDPRISTPMSGPSIFSQTADEIERLREQLRLANIDNFNTTAEVERLRAERDEARRSVCEMCVELGGVFRRVGGKIVEVTTAEDCAEIMRWDCFKENT